MVNNNEYTAFANPVKSPLKLLIVSTILIVLAGTINPVSAVTWYVSPGGNDEDNGGTGWDDAFLTIQQGVSTAGNGDIVLVADGTYSDVGNYDINFGIESKNIVIKSLNGPENCIIDCLGLGRGFRIARSQTNDTVIDGFTIVSGNTNGTYSYGGAIQCDGTYPIIRNCIFKDNTSGQWSGALDFRNYQNENAKVINCVFIGNSASLSGGAIGTYYATPDIINCTFYNNSAPMGGTFGFGSYGGATIINSIFWNNEAPLFHGSPIVTYSLVPGGYTGEGNIDDDPNFIDILSGDLRLAPDSPCIDAGKSDASDVPANDLDGKPRFIDGDNDYSVVVDMGPYEYGDICECDGDTPMDFDTDGLDLANYINNPESSEVSTLAEDFGRADCPNYQFQYTP